MQKSFQSQCEIFSKQSAVLLSFVIPISTAGTHVVLVALLASWFLSGHLQEKVQYIFKHPVARITLILFGLFLGGATYSKASLENITELLDKVSKLLYLPFLLPLMTEEKWRKKMIGAFVIAMLLTLFLSILKVYGGLPIATRYTAACVFKDHIYTNLMMAFASFVIGHYALNDSNSDSNKLIKIVSRLLIFPLVFYIFYMSEGRSGYIIFASLWLLLGLQRYRFRGVFIVLMAILLISGLAYTQSTRFQQRVGEAVQDLEKYWQGNANTSVGSRLEFSVNSLKLAKQHPWLGWGTGSFKEVYKEGQEITQSQSPEKPLLLTNNPHNEYLNIFLQLGIVGLFTFLGFLTTILMRSFSLPKPEQWLAQGLLVAMAVGCMANSWLMDSTAGYFFIVLIACFFGALKVKEQ